ncbi:MAG TPA: hypothetical protein DDW52_14245 [Planctomycetaceae bacterium]|nr:hypothetical protein [Planctomycetaceae bacterium]
MAAKVMPQTQLFAINKGAEKHALGGKCPILQRISEGRLSTTTKPSATDSKGVEPFPSMEAARSEVFSTLHHSSET